MPPPRLLPAVAGVLGTLPGLTLLSLSNHAKFGPYSPLSSGPKAAGGSTAAMSYLAVFFLGAIVLLVVWLLTRPRHRALVGAHPCWSAAGLAALGGAAVMGPEVWAVLSPLGDGVHQLVAVLRIRDLGILEGAPTRGRRLRP